MIVIIPFSFPFLHENLDMELVVFVSMLITFLCRRYMVHYAAGGAKRKNCDQFQDDSRSFVLISDNVKTDTVTPFESVENLTDTRLNTRKYSVHQLMRQ